MEGSAPMGIERLPAEPSSSRQTTPDAFAPPHGHPRFPLFDSLRAIAALSVLLLHAATFSNALTVSRYRSVLAHLDIGVTIFFLISGFLLYRPMVATRVLGAPSTPWPVYAWRRLLRIAPAYWFALAALAAFPGIIGVFSGNWWVYFGLLQNYPVYTLTAECNADLANCGIPPVWSLGIEVGFYAALPFFAWGLGRLGARAGARRWFTTELVALGLVGVISVPFVLRVGTDLERVLWASPLGHGLWFALGMAMAAASVRIAQTGREPRALAWISARPGFAWSAAAGSYLLASLLILDPASGLQISDGQYVFEYLLFGLIAALLIVPAAFGDGRAGMPRRILASPVLGWLGLVSYGIFLYHWPVAYALYRAGVNDWWPAASFPIVTALTLAITLVCAALSYYLLERPILRYKNRAPGSASPSLRRFGRLSG